MGLIMATAMTLITPAMSSHHNSIEPVLNANELLRQAVAKEIPAEKNGYYAWMDRIQKPRGSVTKLMVNTPQGILSRTVAVNDRPLTAQERQQDDARMNSLLDPENMRAKAKKQQEDQQHIERLLRALPDAFRCEYASAPHDEHNVRLECSPAPNYSAPNHESQVYQGMRTVILIDRPEKRITSIEGTLFRDVSFGWGFLGRLNRGGHIEVTQSRVADRHWGLTRMQINFDGRILIFKSLHIEQTETAWGYCPVPKMTVAQALEFLRNHPTPASP